MMRMRLVLVAVLAASMLTSCGSASPPVTPPGIRAPVVVRRVEPDYPPELRAAGVQGVVKVSGTIPKEGGTLRNPKVVWSDDPRLDPFALDAVSRWVWEPGMQDGQAGDVEFTTSVTFSVDR